MSTRFLHFTIADNRSVFGECQKCGNYLDLPQIMIGKTIGFFSDQILQGVDKPMLSNVCSGLMDLYWLFDLLTYAALLESFSIQQAKTDGFRITLDLSTNGILLFSDSCGSRLNPNQCKHWNTGSLGASTCLTCRAGRAAGLSIRRNWQFHLHVLVLVSFREKLSDGDLAWKPASSSDVWW